MSNGARRVTVTIDFEDTTSDEDAMRQFVEEVESEVIFGVVQDLPDLGAGRQVQS